FIRFPVYRCYTTCSMTYHLCIFRPHAASCHMLWSYAVLGGTNNPAFPNRPRVGVCPCSARVPVTLHSLPMQPIKFLSLSLHALSQLRDYLQVFGEGLTGMTS
ncbi:unnamed protein product, partial [Ectocarpus fasciculatus]